MMPTDGRGLTLLAFVVQSAAIDWRDVIRSKCASYRRKTHDDEVMASISRLKAHLFVWQHQPADTGGKELLLYAGTK
jgi:hypothetical protein